MSLLILGRCGESKIITNLGGEVEIRIVRIEADRVLLDVNTRKPREKSYQTISMGPDRDLPAFLKKQAD